MKHGLTVICVSMAISLTMSSQSPAYERYDFRFAFGDCG